MHTFSATDQRGFVGTRNGVSNHYGSTHRYSPPQRIVRQENPVNRCVIAAIMREGVR